ncbi:unnamed protein product [Parascedosporium putredinis]|uniref:Uncharacterized protein n=1 Tax=Parascedosporium putredinis TaxID=1442378 RepID=A0A9P1MA12_9PEZI|nr:unnamed protein product [Parascedosporium putredinis]CAI7991861.1 unnamed protein product [Parascedosporium putredinis]
MPSLFHFLLSLSLATFVAAGNLQLNKPDPRKMLDVTEPITIEWRIDAGSPETKYTQLDISFLAATDTDVGYSSYVVAANLSVNVGISIYAWDPSELARDLLKPDLVLSKEEKSIFDIRLHGGPSNEGRAMGHRFDRFVIEGYGSQLGLGDMVRPTLGLSVLLAAAVLLLVGASEAPVTSKPRRGTALAGAGWWDETTTWSLIWYFDEFNNLVHLNRNSGIAAVLLGATDGIRVYVHSEQYEIHSLSFTNDRDWKYDKIVNPDRDKSSTAIGALSRFGNSNEITLITPKDGTNMEETKLDPDGIWYIDTFPTPLQVSNLTSNSNRTAYGVSEKLPNSAVLSAWDGAPGNIGVAIGPKSRSLFYIGTDRALHQLDSFPSSRRRADEVDPLDTGTWKNVADQDTSRWPLADKENSEFAFTTWLDDKGGNIRLFYMAEGKLTQVIYSNETWHQAEPVATKPKPKKSLSKGAKAGISVGSIIGGLLLLASAAALYRFRERLPCRRRKPRLPISDPKFTPVLFTEEPKELPVHSIHAPYGGQTHEMSAEDPITPSSPPLQSEITQFGK